LKLEEYEYEVVYNKGSNNNNADALSRIHVTEGYTDRHDDKSGLKEEKRYFKKCMINRLEVI